MAPYALRPTDVVNIGQYNLLWSGFYQAVLGPLYLRFLGSGEQANGVTPVLFALFLIGGVTLARQRDKPDKKSPLFAMWLASVLLFAVVIRWGHFWPWAWIYSFIPGASGMHVISRIQLVLIIPVILVACDVLAAGSRQPGTLLVFVLLSVLLLIEQVNNTPAYQIDRPEKLAFFAAMNHVPASCRVFFAENSAPGPDALTRYRHNVDLMILAELSGTPTINGYATFLPPHWDLLHPEQPTYRPAVEAWLARHQVQGPVCGIDFRTGVWSVAPGQAKQPQGPLNTLSDR